MYIADDIDDRMGSYQGRRGVVSCRPTWDWAAPRPSDHKRTNERGGAPESVYQRANRAVDEAEGKR